MATETQKQWQKNIDEGRNIYDNGEMGGKKVPFSVWNKITAFIRKVSSVKEFSLKDEAMDLINEIDKNGNSV